MAEKYKFRAGSRVTLFNLDTGEPSNFHPVDAKVCLDRGGWSVESPGEKKEDGRKAKQGNASGQQVEEKPTAPKTGASSKKAKG